MVGENCSWGNETGPAGGVPERSVSKPAGPIEILSEIARNGGFKKIHPTGEWMLDRFGGGIYAGDVDVNH